MKIRLLTRFFTLLALAVSSLGLLATAVQAAEYSTSLSGAVRVEAISTENSAKNDGHPLLSTGFGGDEEESSTGGDTYLQWNHRIANDAGNTVGTGFIRFASDGDVRVNVESTSTLGAYSGSLKAEWETVEGFGGPVTERDQFAIITNDNTGLYYKIGREEWFGNQKGYSTDFLSQTKDIADGLNGGSATPDDRQKQANTNFGSNRFAATVFGWNGFGVHTGLFFQENNLGASDSSPLGISFKEDCELTNICDTANTNHPNGIQAGDVRSWGLLFGISRGVLDFDMAYATTEVKGFGDNDKGSISEAQLALNFERASVFVNYGQSEYEENNVAAGQVSPNSNSQNIINAESSGYNLGVSIHMAGSDLVIAYGNGEYDDNSNSQDAESLTANDYKISAYDVMWAMNNSPFKFSVGFSRSSKEYDLQRSAIQNDDIREARGEDEVETRYGVRMEVGF